MFIVPGVLPKGYATVADPKTNFPLLNLIYFNGLSF